MDVAIRQSLEQIVVIDTALVEIGPEGTSYSLEQVQSARLELGRLWIVNRAGEEVLVFDTIGRHLHTIRADDVDAHAPFSTIADCRGAGVLVMAGRRGWWYDPGDAWRPRGTVDLTGVERRSVAQSVSLDCDAVLYSRRQIVLPPSDEATYQHEALFWVSMVTGRHDTVGVFEDRETIGAFITGLPQPLSLPWGRDGHWAAAGDHVYVAKSDRAGVTAHDRMSDESIALEWTQRALPVTRHDRSLYAQRRGFWLKRFPQLRELIPPLDRFPRVPGTKPLFAGLLGTDDGVWVRGYPDHLAGRPDLYDWDRPLYERPKGKGDREEWLVVEVLSGPRAIVVAPADVIIEDVEEDQVVVIRTGPRIQLLPLRHVAADGSAPR